MKVLIAMSGGVDSSVAAYLMKEQDHEGIGCTMKLYDNDDAGISREHTCCSLDDVEDARAVAARLGMPHYVFNFRDGFREKVIDKFIRCYKNARTPNPCIDCNRYMKFEKLHQRALELGCNAVVTGHYARVEFENGKYLLKKALDDTKDQSYVLYSLTQELLAHTLFPLGGMKKTETRAIAEANDFINADKPDSQDICFVPNGDYAAAIERFTGEKDEPGDFVDLDGKVLGQHKGITHYTIGQRKGLGIAAGEPIFVCRIDPVKNTVVLSREDALFSKVANVSEFNWISGEAPTEPIRCSAKIRYRHKEQPATVYPMGANRVRIVFDEPQRAITAGQAAVLYDGDVVLGGGVIDDSADALSEVNGL